MFSKPPGSSFSCSSFRLGCTYDVFLSFRGDDTRYNFTDHLYTALVRAGIHTVRDNDELTRGKEISSQLHKAIRESRISIVIFSKGYASSKWCLNELVEILDCKHTKGQNVLPIFYHIDPSNVRNQTGSFAEAFDRHKEQFREEMERVNKWREALMEAGSLSGLGLINEANRHESEFIQKIVKEVSDQLDRKYLNVATHVVGIDYLLHDIVARLSIATNDVRILGIHGMAGIGKTTIAKVAFNRLCYKFEGSCFLSNVGEISKQTNGLALLQHQLLCDILKPNRKTGKFSCVHRGTNLIRDRLCHKRIIVVLDGVDQLEQLKALVGQRNWFGPGSGIIVTSRDEHLLTQIEVDWKYKAKEMDQNKSLQLFSWHAFRDAHPKEDYMELSNAIVKYAGGVPLALEVLGCFLFKRSIPAWKSAIEKLQTIPHPEILKKLRISFDSLDDDKVKGIFLDIACFFVGWDKDYVAKILDGRGFFPDIGIDLLITRSLVTINQRNQFEMHNLLRDMGREIVREKATDGTGSRSRIWYYEDAVDLLNKQMGTQLVEGLALDISSSAAVSFSTKSFTKMRHLKLLQINGVHFTGSYENLPKELIWLCWQECPLQSLPPNFQLDRIVVLDMQYSNIKELCTESKTFNKLKILNLSHSKYLTKTPNFHKLPNLEKLILEDCQSLTKVHQSIGCLERLVFLNLEGCCRLKNLPESMGDLKSLKTLSIMWCLKLEKLPECLGDMESLTELLADGTPIKQIPNTIGRLKNLKDLSLSLCGCKYHQNLPSPSRRSLISSWFSPGSSKIKAFLPATLFGLSSLRELNIANRGLSEDVISIIDLRGLSSLVVLDLSGNKFFNLPSGLGYLPKLGALKVDRCTNLVSILQLPSCLWKLSASYCNSLETLLIHSETGAELEIEGVGNKSSMYIFLEGCNNLSSNSKKSIVQAMDEEYDLVFTGGAIPEWFSHNSDGDPGSFCSSVSFKVPHPISEGILEGLLLWVVYGCINGGRPSFLHADVTVRRKNNGLLVLQRPTAGSTLDKYCRKYSWVSRMKWKTRLLPSCAIEAGDEFELSVQLLDYGGIKDITVERCGVHLILEKPNQAADFVESSDGIEESQGSSAIAIPYPSLRSTDWLMRELQESQICTVWTDYSS